MANTIEHEINFSVSTALTYYLSVVIGNGQGGGTTFENPGGTMYDDDTILNALIGTGSAIKGQSVFVDTSVDQINPDNKNIIVSYYITTNQITNIKNAVPTGSFKYLADEEESVDFFYTINFQ